jgi:hypothetical protein
VGVAKLTLVAPPPETFTLFASGLRTQGDRGTRPVGARTVVTGMLATEPGGPAVGELLILSAMTAPPSLLEPGAAGLEAQTFVLPGGTLAGTGVLHDDCTGTFAVIGGTGEYADARGSYTVAQQAGVAEYAFTLRPRQNAQAAPDLLTTR